MFVASSSSKGLHAYHGQKYLKRQETLQKCFRKKLCYLGADVCHKSGSKISVFQPVQQEAPGGFLYLNTSVLIKGGIGLLIDEDDYYY